MNVFFSGAALQRVMFPIGALAVLSGLSACTHIHPDAPPTIASPAPPPPQLSVITVPIDIDANAIAAALDAQLSDQNGGVYWTTGQDIGSGTTLQIGVHRDGHVSVLPDNGCMDMSIPLKTDRGRVDKDITLGPPWARIHNRHHADIPDRHIDIRAKVCIGVTNDWLLTASFQPSFSWAQDPVVEYHLPSPFPVIRINIADRVNPKLQEMLPRFTSEAQNQLAKVPLHQYTEKAWIAMQQSVKAWQDPVVALEIEPVSVGIGPLSSSGDSLIIRPAVTAYVRTRLGEPTAAAPVVLKPLPNNAGTPPSDSIHVLVQAIAPFKDINANLADRIVGKTLQLEGNRTIIIKDAKTFGYGEQVGLRVDFAAKTSTWPLNNVSGWAYLVGKPRFDFDKRQISVENLEFDEKTSSLLVDAAAVIAHPYVREQLQKAMTVDVSRYVDPVVRQVRSGLTGYQMRPGILANLMVTNITVTDIKVSREDISIFLDADGTANLAVSNDAAVPLHIAAHAK